MKRLTVLSLLLFISAMLLCSCSPDSERAKTPDEAAEQTIASVIKCFESKDKEALKSYFSESVREEYDLDEQIEAAFEFVDSAVVSYGAPVSRAGGTISDKSYGAYYDDIVTENGTTYKIDFSGKYRFDDDRKREGIRWIRVINMTGAESVSDEAEKEQFFFYIGDHS